VRPTAKTPPAVALRPVAPPDDDFLLRLYADTRSDELGRTNWNASQREVFLRQQFNARRADYRARFPGAEVSIILIAGETAGVLEVWRGPSEIRLVNVEIAARFRGSGAGSTLVRGLLSEGAAGRLPVVLNVREDNHGAQRLYRRLGFLAESRSNGYVAMRAAPKNR
jgi:ribosomal protein S18 acetylase RimI-like enzyme